ncbi:MAG: flagellin, partial [Lachnospiraceae bacterium]|nr:flagellin [Lachnospiraceae bacterium]MBO4903784.1 flagellin [Lachnospiraceae bacterium]
TTSTYEKTSGGEIKNYVSNGSGGYKEAAYNTLYVMDTDTGHDKDTAGNTYHALTNGDGSGQRYLQTGSAYIAVKTYDYDHYKYSAKNSDGTEIMSNNASGTKFLKTGGTGEYITITNSDGSTTVYRTENNSTYNSATISGNGASISLNYTSGSGNKSNTITVTPNGVASRTFTKASRSAGTSSDTNLTVKVNPPMKQLDIQAGALQGQVITLEWPALSNSIVGISGAKVNSVETSLSTIKMTEDALDYISTVRSGFGAMQNRLESAYRIDRNTQENTQAAESLIRDADMAKEMVAHSRNEILTSAAMSMLSQANAQPQSILSLLS